MSQKYLGVSPNLINPQYTDKVQDLGESCWESLEHRQQELRKMEVRSGESSAFPKHSLCWVWADDCDLWLGPENVGYCWNVGESQKARLSDLSKTLLLHLKNLPHPKKPPKPNSTALWGTDLEGLGTEWGEMNDGDTGAPRAGEFSSGRECSPGVEKQRQRLGNTE